MSEGVFLKGNVKEKFRWFFIDIRMISLFFNHSRFELNLFLNSMRSALGIMNGALRTANRLFSTEF